MGIIFNLDFGVIIKNRSANSKKIKKIIKYLRNIINKQPNLFSLFPFLICDYCIH